jgi:hypothetical protein
VGLGLERRGEASPLRTSLGAWHTARVVVPYTKLRPEVIWALQESGRDYELVDVSAHDSSYFGLWSELWLTGEPFVIVEHDIVVSRYTLTTFDRCDQPWCVAKYAYLGGNYWGLGCTRFAGSLTRAFPDMVEDVATYEDERHPPAHWCSLDAAITQALHRRLRAWPHLHGFVEHLSDGRPTHGCRG